MRIKKGFTFIEVMIAIAVFSIGVLAVLNLIMYNLGTIDKVQTKITATLLAKEGLELAYNIRDTNMQKGFAWDCLLKRDLTPEQEVDDVCAMRFAAGDTGTVFQFGFSTGSYYTYNRATFESGFDARFAQNALYYYTGEVGGNAMFWYGYAQEGLSGTATPFARYISFTPVKDAGATISTDKLLKVESHVLYKKGSYQGDIVLESFMGHF